MMHNEEIHEVEWEAPEFQSAPKDVGWYWISMIIAILIVGFSVWQRNFLFGFFIIVAEILVIVWAHREPSKVHFLLNEKELVINHDKFHSLKDMKGFSVFDNDKSDNSEIIIIFKHLKPSIRVSVPNSRLEEVKSILLLKVPEEDFEPSFADTIERMIGF